MWLPASGTIVHGGRRGQVERLEGRRSGQEVPLPVVDAQVHQGLALALAELVVYLAAAPKSNALYVAYGQAAKDALQTRAEPVPLWIRNAPTRLMKDLGYGHGYRYAHDEAEGVSGMDCLPEALLGRRYYRPTERGAETGIAARLEAARLVRERKKSDSQG